MWWDLFLSLVRRILTKMLATSDMTTFAGDEGGEWSLDESEGFVDIVVG
jgi:hypothetical protein